ncbi:dethiobiotin synthase [Chitinophaga rhizosphaerae]|uniref:dethiobiotin synthase n=1 Tax=Chitinophaga rhizosphaerae TaxID=1864947 RepID=UPI000F7FD7E5|nr:dethiobiotin synthase [Chitinophaga rhizosphaerae]
MNNIFITGIGTGVGKTIASACVAEALGAQYWKPVQAGIEDGTDTETVRALTSPQVTVHEELYRLAMPASPHLAARAEGIVVQEDRILQRARQLQQEGRPLVIEGAGGLMVPLNGNYFFLDLARALGARVIVVAQNYLGSINHSLLTAMALRNAGLNVTGWIFSGDYHTNEDDVVAWSQYPLITRIPKAPRLDKAFIALEAEAMRPKLQELLGR